MLTGENLDREIDVSVPSGLLIQLASFRRALVSTLTRENLIRLMLACLLLFVSLMILDRFIETPIWARVVLCGALLFLCGMMILQIGRLAWANRDVNRAAQTVRRFDPLFGDHLVGALELAGARTDHTSSNALRAAAIQQVAEEASARNLLELIPTRVSVWTVRGCVFLAGLSVACFFVSPSMVRSTAQRLFLPWSEVPRYTFAGLIAESSQVIVPMDESAEWEVRADTNSRWTPSRATLHLGHRQIVSREIQDNTYRFTVPRLIESVSGVVHLGDARMTVQFVPMQRPALQTLEARLVLPSYLTHAGTDHLGEPISTTAGIVNGVLEMVEGSRAVIHATVSSALLNVAAGNASGSRSWSGQTDQQSFSLPVIEGIDKFGVQWTDEFGLQPADSLQIYVKRTVDQPPTLIVREPLIPSRVLQTHQLVFDVLSEDDFGIHQIGMTWQSQDATGDIVLGDAKELMATFQAEAAGVPSGEVRLRFWATDRYPGRKRVYSPAITFTVLSPNEHAVWIADEFDKWRQSAMDVRDRELSLYQRNRQLQETPLEQRDETWRAELQRQARDESLNARLLQSLALQGQDLLRQAARNQEVESSYLESLAESVESLQSLAQERMPRIAKQLGDVAEQASQFADMIDQESSQSNLQNQVDESSQVAETDQGEGGETKERIGLADTTIVDTTRKKSEKQDQAAPSLVEVLDDQTDLVAEFDAVAEQLSNLLGKMEGSTLVKRLKSISRLQERAAVRLGRQIDQTFGASMESPVTSIQVAVDDFAESARRVRTVLDDLDAFCQRRDIKHFQSVLSEMKSANVTDSLSSLVRTVEDRPGTSIAVAEYWADNLDRWADDLVDPRGGDQPDSGPQTTKSLSPDIVLEVLRILESEMDLRERTRTAEQGKSTMGHDQYMGAAIALSEAQDLLRDRLDLLVDRIESIPDGVLHFEGEIQVLAAASSAMVDATKTLVQPETGPPAIAAETEAIELLLRSKKVSPESGGGGGGTAGGGSGGTTDQAAARLVGQGLNELAKDRVTESDLNRGLDRERIPAQWLSDLDSYYQRLEARVRGSR